MQRLRPVTVKAPWPPHLQSHQHTDAFLRLYSFRFSIFLNLLYFLCLRLLPAYIEVHHMNAMEVGRKYEIKTPWNEVLYGLWVKN